MAENDDDYKPFRLTFTYFEGGVGGAPSEGESPFQLKGTFLGMPDDIKPATKNITALGIPPEGYGKPFLIFSQYIRPPGFFTGVFSQPKIDNFVRYLRPVGLLATGFTNPNIRNFNQEIRVSGYINTVFPTHKTYNLRQFIVSRGLYAALYGTAYLQGGVRYLTINGFNASAVPNVKVINTRADQYVDLRTPSRGIAPPEMSQPTVSPRFIRPGGILAWSFGTPWVQRNPSPKGFTTDLYGNAWVSHSPRYIQPAMVEAFLSGYAKAFDPTQRIRHEDSPKIPGGIFGDIGIRNSRRIISVPGADQSSYGDWSSIFSNLTDIHVQSFDSQFFGDSIVWNKTPSVVPGGFDAAVFGNTFISDRIRRILGRGFGLSESERFGKHTLTKPPELKPGSIVSQAFGTATIGNWQRFIFSGAINALKFDGDIRVWFRYRHLSPGGIVQAAAGTPKIEHGVRYLLPGGADTLRLGTPTIWFKVRSISATGIFREFESNHTVGGTQHIKPSGYVATLFGERVVPENRAIYGLGFNGQAFPETHKIELHTRWVRTTGFASVGQQPSDRYGTAKIWNLRQYIRHEYDSGDGLNPPPFGQWTAINNRNRVIRPAGFDASRHSYHNIDNNARPLKPAAFDSARFGQSMIADRIRRLRIEPIEAPYLSGWGRVHNAAAQLLVPGGKHDMWGFPAVLNTRREYRWVGAFESMSFGVPMVAFRIRNIGFENRYSIGPVSMPLPKVEQHTRYIEPIFKYDDMVGGPSLVIKWNIITPRWTHRELFGDPSVRNVTPELRQRGINHEEFGNPSLRLQWRKFAIEGFGSELFGKLNIAYRDRMINVSGFDTFRFGQHKAVRTGAPPYSLQQITLDWGGEGQRPDDYEGNGIRLPESQVSRPSLRSNVLFAEGFVATRYGTHHIQSNGIIVEPGIQEFTIGEHEVKLKNREIKVPTMGDLLQFENVKPRLSPHTIYAVNNAPPLAIANHPTVNPITYINYHRNTSYPPGEIFGRPTIALRHRRLDVYGPSMLSVGRPSLQLRKNYIAVTGINSFRMGWHVFLDGSPQTTEQYDSKNHAVFGQITLINKYYGPQTIRPTGFNVALYGRPVVDFLNRTIKASSWVSTLMGTRLYNDTPYKPKGLWVGEPMPTIPNGFNAELFGSTTIGLKVRGITTEGFDSFSSEMDISNFKGRMKVELVKKPVVIQEKNVFAQSFNQTAYGVPDIRLKVHYIRPDGNSDQYRKGAPE